LEPRNATGEVFSGLAIVESDQLRLPGQLADDATVSRPPVRFPWRRKSSGATAVAGTLASKILQQGINAATGIITARALMPTGRGQLAATILWSQFLAGLTTFGLPSSIIYFTRKMPARAAEISASGLAMSIASGLLTMIVGIFFLPSWLHQYPHPVIFAAQWFLTLTPVCSVTLVARAVLEANGEFGKSNLQQLLVPFLTLLGLFVALAFGHLNVTIGALCYTLPALPAFLFLCSQVTPLLRHRRSPSVWGSLALLSYGIRSWGIDLLGTLGIQVDQVLVVRLLTPTNMGYYVVMLSLSRMLGIIQFSAVTVLFPKASGLSTEEVIEVTGRTLRVSAALTVSGAVVLGVAGPVLLRLLYGKEYLQGVNTFRVLLLEMLLAGSTFLLSQAFMAVGRPGFVTALQAVGLTISIPGMLWLIPRWGILGAAIALLISTISRFVLIYISFPLVLKTNAPDLRFKSEDAKSILAIIGRLAGACIHPEMKGSS
jgi:O-antigen/teichoic acid export membrane protein